MYIANAFSLQMVQDFPVTVTVTEIEAKDVDWDVDSAIGHADTAAVVSKDTGKDLEATRVNISLNSGDYLFVAQVVGGRLPEGATTLPDGFGLKYLRVDIH